MTEILTFSAIIAESTEPINISPFEDGSLTVTATNGWTGQKLAGAVSMINAFACGSISCGEYREGNEDVIVYAKAIAPMAAADLKRQAELISAWFDNLSGSDDE